ncbi:MAG: cobyrinate a,c-diamide synthase [Dehalococcoidia bacterium]|nr:cobyrinate a,c-diamide synthase [Dehalococcoidia bacterium]
MRSLYNPPRIVIAGVTSGVGKTTISVGIMGALMKRGLRVQPFKVGPDYIDPTYHQAIAGVPSRNLDSWMLTEDAVLRTFIRATRDADMAVIEGVMGLYDGRYGERNSGSTAHVARILGAPVLLIVDVAKMAQSAAAVVLGFKSYDPSITIAGVILNNVASERHLRMAEQAIVECCGVPVLGGLPKSSDMSLPERHLGLVPTQEGLVPRSTLENVVNLVEAHIDIDSVLRLASSAKPLSPPSDVEVPSLASKIPVRLAVAMDEAFSFYYPDNLDLLRDIGAEIVPFSPVRDAALPPDVDGIYIGGGFPELYAEELSKNVSMKESIKNAASAGIPLYGECGGLMYLSGGITGFDGRAFPMVGLVPGWCAMQNKRVSLGYLTVEARNDSILMKAGTQVRGHEFHWSSIERGDIGHDTAYNVIDQPGRVEGYAQKNVLASYLHIHFGAMPALAANLLSSCAAWRNRKKDVT